MSTINDGGPAFPMQDQQAIHAWAQARIECMGLATTAERDAAYIQARAEAVGGMSLRDYFAAKAMNRINGCDPDGVLSHESIAWASYRLADAMLKAREQTGGTA